MASTDRAEGNAEKRAKEEPAQQPITPISRRPEMVVPMMARWTKKIGAVAIHRVDQHEQHVPASGEAAMPMPCADMNSACASASTAMFGAAVAETANSVGASAPAGRKLAALQEAVQPLQ